MLLHVLKSSRLHFYCVTVRENKKANTNRDACGLYAFLLHSCAAGLGSRPAWLISFGSADLTRRTLFRGRKPRGPVGGRRARGSIDVAEGAASQTRVWRGHAVSATLSFLLETRGKLCGDTLLLPQYEEIVVISWLGKTNDPFFEVSRLSC